MSYALLSVAARYDLYEDRRDSIFSAIHPAVATSGKMALPKRIRLRLTENLWQFDSPLTRPLMNCRSLHSYTCLYDNRATFIPFFDPAVLA